MNIRMRLVYLISERWLAAGSDTESILIRASSGGRGGSTLGPDVETIEANNASMTEMKWRRKNGKTVQNGGPLPAGAYKVHRPMDHKKLGRCAFLEPQFPTKRSELFIHGPVGPMGSQGCIVPHEKEDFDRLIRALDRERGGILTVYERMDPCSRGVA